MLPVEKELVHQLRYLTQSKMNIMERLKSLKKCHRLRAEFLRKSGQALRQQRLQALVLLGIYFALLIFVLRQFQWEDIVYFVVLSACLMSLGVFVLYRMGRRIKWKLWRHPISVF
jgi:hypothetical protein